MFPDHADPLQWYYLPTSPHLTDPRRHADVPADRVPRGSRTGGLLSFDCNIGLDRGARSARCGRRSARSSTWTTIRASAPVPLVDGTVRLIAMGTDSAAVPVEGEPAPEPQFVVKAMHNAKPSLYGENQASFSVLLDEAGYALVRGTLDAAIMPVAVIYSLDYLALRPAYQVTLSIDWDRVQKHLDETFGAKLWIFSSDISKVVDELDESKAIDLRADTFVARGHRGGHRPPRRRAGPGQGDDHHGVLRGRACRPGRPRQPDRTGCRP